MNSYKVVQRGDLVVNKMKAWQGSLGVSDFDGIVSPAYIVCGLPADLDRVYFNLLLRSRPYVNMYDRLSFGVRVGQWDLRYADLKQLAVFLPPLDEQRAIARFLHHADRRFNQLIRAKQRLIALLNEQKQAIIQRAVTRGLDPDVRFKPSGVEWLGEVPEHWSLVPNRAHLQLRKESVGSRSSDYTLLSLTMQGVIPRDLENAKGKFPANFDAYQVVKPGDLVFCLFDIDETPRTVGVAHEEGMITGAYTVFSCKDESIRDYYYYFYLALDNIKALKPVYTGLRKVIPRPVFLGLKSPVPPEDERLCIVKFIRENVRQLEDAITKARKEIEFVGEYRTRLIADVITGKLDVRGVDVPDPEDLEELLDTDVPDEEEHLSMQEAI